MRVAQWKATPALRELRESHRLLHSVVQETSWHELNAKHECRSQLPSLKYHQHPPKYQPPEPAFSSFFFLQKKKKKKMHESTGPGPELLVKDGNRSEAIEVPYLLGFRIFEAGL